MIYERALVLDTFQTQEGVNMARVKTQRQSTCNSCQLKAGCGQSLIANIVGGKGIELNLQNELNASEGDVVVLEISEGGVLKASLLMFMLPLLVMVFGTAFATLFLPPDSLGLVFAALVSLFIGFVSARKHAQLSETDPSLEPKMSSLGLSQTHVVDVLPILDSSAQVSPSESTQKCRSKHL